MPVVRATTDFSIKLTYPFILTSINTCHFRVNAYTRSISIALHPNGNESFGPNKLVPVHKLAYWH